MPIDSTRDPENMTEAERRDEVASILARGLSRAIAATRAERINVGQAPARDAGLDTTRD